MAGQTTQDKPPNAPAATSPPRGRMHDPLTLVLEFLRKEKASDPYAFRFEPQLYSLRTMEGRYETAELAWTGELLSDLTALRTPRPDPVVLQRLGQTLHQFLDGMDFDLYEVKLQQAIDANREVLLTIRSAAAELYALPWELLTLQSGRQLGELPNVVIRYEWPGHKAIPPSDRAFQEAGRILVAWAGNVPADKQIAAIESAAEAGYYPFSRTTDVINNVTLQGLRDVLQAAFDRQAPPIHTLHLLCHGAEVGESFGLALAGERDAIDVIDAARLRAVLTPFAPMLRLVVLSACDSSNSGTLGNQLGSVAQSLHNAGFASVVASRYPLSVDGSVHLTAQLYRSLLVDPDSLEQALCAARKTLLADTTQLDWASVQFFGSAEEGADTRPIVIRPYRGLLPFLPEHGRFFLGREGEIVKLLDKLNALADKKQPRFLIVSGAAGTGKTSLVMAGIMPRLLAQRPGLWVARMRPGRDPDAQLDLQLAELRNGAAGTTPPAEPPQTLLVVDQLEQIFTEIDESARRQAFVQRLWRLAADAASRMTVIVVIRFEYIGRCGEILVDGRTRALDKLALDPAHRLLLTQVDAQELPAIIEQPAANVGLRFETGLAEQLLEDVIDMPSGQPLLQDMLDMLWQRRDGDLLTQAAYQELGGLSGALQKRADSIIGSFDAARERVARRLFVRLVSSSEVVNLSVRRCVPIDQLYPDDPAEYELFEDVLARLQEARLLVSNQDALPAGIHSAENAALSVGAAARHTSTVAALSSAVPHVAASGAVPPSGKPPGSPPGKAGADGWNDHAQRLALKHPDLANLLHRELGDKHDALRGEVSLNRSLNRSGILRSAVSGSSAVMRPVPTRYPQSAMIEVAHEALIRKWGRLQTWLQADRAMITEIQRLEGWVRAWVEMQTLLVGNQLSVATDLANRFPHDLPRGTHELLHHSTQHARRRRRMRQATVATMLLSIALLILFASRWYHANQRAHAEASKVRDALRIVAAGEHSTDPLHRAELLREVEADDPVALPGWLALATGALHDILPAQPPITLGPHPDHEPIGISEDCSTAVSTRPDASVWLHPLAGGSSRVISVGHRDRVLRARLSRDRTLLLTASRDGTARIVNLNLQIGSPPLVLRDPGGAVLSAQFSPDTQSVVTIDEDGSCQLHTLGTAGLPTTLVPAGAGVRLASFSPDGGQILTGDRTGMLRLFDRAGRPTATLSIGAGIVAAAFSQDGRALLAASEDKRVRIFDRSDLTAPPQVLSSPLTGGGRMAPTARAEISPTGQQLLALGSTHAQLWTQRALAHPATLATDDERILFGGFCSDDRRLYALLSGGRVQLWNQQHDRIDIALRALPSENVTSARFSPDGGRLALASGDRSTAVWTADGSGTPLILGSQQGGITALAFGPDHSLLVTGSEDSTIGVWNDREQVHHRALRGHTGTVTHLALGDGGRLLASAASDRQVRLWNLADAAAPSRLLCETRGAVTALEISPDGRTLIVVSQDSEGSPLKTVTAWNTAAAPPPDAIASSPGAPPSTSPGNPATTSPPADAPPRTASFDVLYRGPLRHIGISPDGKLVYGVLEPSEGGPPAGVRIWPLDGRGGMWMLPDVTTPPDVTSAVFSVDSSRLFLAVPGELWAWHLRTAADRAGTGTGKLDRYRLPSRQADAAPGTAPAAGPILSAPADGKQLIALFPDEVRTVTLTGDQVRTVSLPQLGSTITPIVSPDGKTALLIDRDARAWLLSLTSTGEPLAAAILRRLWLASRRCADSLSLFTPSDGSDSLLHQQRHGNCLQMQTCLTAHTPPRFDDCLRSFRHRHRAMHE